MPITLPALRDRREDIASLAEFLIGKFNKLHGRKIRGFDKRALAALRLYGWPGNIRELENVVEHAFIVEVADTITLDSLPDHVASLVARKGATADDEGLSVGLAGEGLSADSSNVLSGVSELNYPQLKEKFEREFIIKALKAFDGRINQTAEHTQMTKVTLLRKLEKYGIDPKQYHRQ